MSSRTGFLLIHGAWHDHHSWDSVVPLLEAAGHVVKAIDLPGAGTGAAIPSSFENRPLDHAAFGAEPSPNAGVSQEERTAAAIAALRALNAQTGGRAVIVGHSLGGITVSPLVEAVPDDVAAAVYVSAFLLPPRMLPIEMIRHDLMTDALVPELFMADPEKTGALRIDVGSDDARYLAKLKAAFFADLNDGQFASAVAHLHPDEPAQVVAVPSIVSQPNFGRVARHYIECTQDRAITLAGQREMVRLVDDAMGNVTHIHTLDSSHSPFHSAPHRLAEILTGIASR